jgi:hypothetical protein
MGELAMSNFVEATGGSPFFLGVTGALARWDGFQAKVVAYDKPERRYIQAWSPNRPCLSPLATVAEMRRNFLWRLLYVFVYLFEFGIVSV